LAEDTQRDAAFSPTANLESLLDQRKHVFDGRIDLDRWLGFKQVKWIEAIEFVDSFEHLGLGQGGYNEDHELYGYRMPI
jgi:DMSO/TMAO reductase YedYZ molybdopterin-dependent catalytic subunit